MTKVAVLDDWQGVAQSSADWSPLLARAEIVFFEQPFADEDDAAAKLADFEIVLSMRERTPLPGSLIGRLSKLRMLGMTGARNRSLDMAACTARGVIVCNTVGDGSNKAGLTPMEVLQTATINPAIFLGVDKDLSTIEKGKIADVVLLDANPLDQITNTRKIDSVVVNGHLLDRKTMDAMLAQVAANAK